MTWKVLVFFLAHFLPHSNASTTQESHQKKDEIEMVEYPTLDQKKYSFSIQGAKIKNQSGDEGLIYYSAGGVRLGFKMNSLLFFEESIQDSLWFDLGVYHYRVRGFLETEGLRYQVTPIHPSLSYRIHLNSKFSLHTLFGVLFQWARPRDENSLQRVSLSAALGFHYAFGPDWEFRGDVGTDFLAAGLVIRY